MAQTSVPDYGRDLGKLEGGVDVLKNLTFAVIGFLGLIVAGGVGLFVVIHQVRTELGERLVKIENVVASLPAGQSSAAASLSRIEGRLAAVAQPAAPAPAQQLLISSDDAKTLRSMLKYDPGTAYKNVGRLGEVLTDAKLLEFPGDVVQKFPLLQSLRYTFDVKHQILIASLPDQRVIAIV